MLPDIRAVLAALVAAVGLLMVSFALVATFRVAQGQRSTALQASLTDSFRTPLAEQARAPTEQPSPERAVLIVETPGPLMAPVPPALDPPIAVKVARIAEAAPERAPVARVERLPIAPIVAALPEVQTPAEPSPAEAAMGGPLVAEPPAPKPETPRVAAVEPVQRDIERRATEQKAVERKFAAEKARKARVAREKKKAAARRAAQARAAKQKAATPFGNNQFGNGAFGGTFTNQ
jgi:hypothetical protein